MINFRNVFILVVGVFLAVIIFVRVSNVSNRRHIETPAEKCISWGGIPLYTSGWGGRSMTSCMYPPEKEKNK